MDNESSNRNPEDAAARGPLSPPINRVIGSVEQASVGPVVADLGSAGFAPVGILAGEAGLQRLRETGAGSGFGALLRRLSLSMGGDLDFIHAAEEEIRSGRAMIDVEVDGEEAKQRARDVMVRHGARLVTFVGQWAITPLA